MYLPMNQRQLLLTVLFFAAMACAAPKVKAHEFTPDGKTLGVGVQVGSPTAVTGKLVLSHDTALAMSMGGGIGWGPSLSVTGDWLLQPFTLIDNNVLIMTPVLGVGGFAAAAPERFKPILPGFEYSRSIVWLGARTPLGLSVALNAAPVEIFAEVDPTLFVWPVVAFDLGATIGLRLFI